MEVQIKKTVKAGNSSAVILPRSWLNKEVRVELIRKTSEIMLSDVLYIIKNKVDLREVIGIYLVGSYARGEEEEESDIDILVVTKDIDKEMIYEGIYNILVVSLELIEQKIKRDLLPVGQMLKEAKPLLNSDYLDLTKPKIKATKGNVSWYLETTKGKLKIIRKALDTLKRKDKIFVSDIVAYTLVLRIRTLYIIDGLIKNKKYSKVDFIKLIKKVSGGINAYERYLAVKNNSKENKGISMAESERLYDYLKNQLEVLERKLKP